jgi:hypothetical protein
VRAERGPVRYVKERILPHIDDQLVRLSGEVRDGRTRRHNGCGSSGWGAGSTDLGERLKKPISELHVSTARDKDKVSIVLLQLVAQCERLYDRADDRMFACSAEVAHTFLARRGQWSMGDVRSTVGDRRSGSIMPKGPILSERAAHPSRRRSPRIRSWTGDRRA